MKHANEPLILQNEGFSSLQWKDAAIARSNRLRPSNLYARPPFLRHAVGEVRAKAMIFVSNTPTHPQSFYKFRTRHKMAAGKHPSISQFARGNSSM